jgi:tRNA/rRNA methyltransferase
MKQLKYISAQKMRELRVIFVGCEKPENAGFICRVMKNFGFHELWFVNPIADLSLATITAKHAIDILKNAKKVASLHEALKDVDIAVATTATRPKSRRNILRNYITPREFAENWAQSRGKTGLLFGREGIGLTNEEISMCDFVVSIPTSEEYPEMNVSHSAAVILYELAIAEERVKAIREMAGEQEKQMLINILKECLLNTSMPKHKLEVAIRVFRNVIGRSYLSEREAKVMIGVFRRLCHQKDYLPS